MKWVLRPVQLLIAAAIGWLLAQSVLMLTGVTALSIQPEPALAPPVVRFPLDHWQPTTPLPGIEPVSTNGLPMTQLPLQWLGQLRTASPNGDLSQSLVVLGFEQEQKVLGVGDRLAPGIRIAQIDQQGIIIDNQGRQERFAWPQTRPMTGVRSLDP